MNATATSPRRPSHIGLERIQRAACLLIFFWSAAILSAAADAAANLALGARPSAFEFQPGLPAGWANDGKMDMRWSAIPGHNVGGWHELDWDQPVRVGQVVVFQHDWYGGSHVGLWEWTGNYGKGKAIASGQTIESTVRLQLMLQE